MAGKSMGDYPRNWRPDDQTLTPDLTTPVAFLTTKNMHDPFGRYVLASSDSTVYGYHRIVPLSIARRVPMPWKPDGTAADPGVGNTGVGNPGALLKYGQWLVHSIGPDAAWGLTFSIPYDWELHDTLYDPTNGTKSFGALARTQLHPEGKIQYRPPP